MANVLMKKIDIGDGNTYYPLPIVSSADNGKILMVVEGEWEATDSVTMEVENNG